MKTFWPGTRVLVFDHLLYKDDKTTPTHTTLKPATVLAWYSRKSLFGGWDTCIDVDFDHRGLSKAHFTSYVREI